MELFDLSATLTLDASSFATGVSQAVSKGKEIGETIDNINTESLEDEIAALDKEIESLDKEISSIESDINTISRKGTVVEGIYQGLADAGRELLKKSLEYVFDFAAESLEMVENSGTAVGNQFSKTKAELTATANVLKMKVGTELATFSIGLMNIAEQVAGVTQEDKLRNMFDQLTSYNADNLNAVAASLESIFGAFEKVDMSNLGFNTTVEEMNSGLESQIAYWEEYDRVIQALKERGVSNEMLASYADGSQESLARLQAFEGASDEELAQMETLFGELESIRSGVATEISNAQLEVDAGFQAMVSSAIQLAQDVEGVDTATAAAKLGKGIVSGLASEYPSISLWTNKIIKKLNVLEAKYQQSQILLGISSPVVYSEPIGPKQYATGLDYVPYDNFPSLLHEGEAVLTKAEATEWRRSSSAVGATIDYSQLAAAIASAMAGFSVQMDGQAIGHLVADTVSKDIAQKSKSRRYT